MRLPVLGQLLSSVLLCASLASAIFQDEAYHVDFQHALLGAPVPRSTFFYQPTLSSKATLLYTISEQGTVGAVNPKDGSLVWRQKQITGGSCGQATGHLGGANGTNSVISAYGDSVSAWEAASGRMLWTFAEVGCIRSLVVPDMPGLTQDPVILMQEKGSMKLISLNAAAGKVIWQVRDDVGDIPHAVTAGSSHIYYVGLRPAKLKGYKILVTTVHPTSAQAVKQNILSADSEIKSEEDVLFVSRRAADPIVVWADKALKTLKINLLGTDDITTIKVPNSGKAVTRISVHASDDMHAKSYFLIQYTSATSHWAEIYGIGKDKTVKKLHDLPEMSGDGVFSASNIKDNVFFTRLTSDETIVHFAATGDVLERWATSPQLKDVETHAEGATHLATEVVTRGTSNYAVRGAVLRRSDDLSLIRNGELEWTRMESLAGITAAAWAETSESEDLARELAIESHNNPLSAYIHRLARHAKDLQHLPDWLQALPTRVLGSLTGAKLGDENLGADFGFQKLVIVATEKGRVVALDTGAHGNVVWTTKVMTLAPGERWNVTDIRVAGDRVLVLVEKGASVTLELSSGAIVDQKAPDSSTQARQVVPASTADGQSIMLQLSSDGTPLSSGSVTLKDDTVVVTNAEDGTLTGWTLDGTTFSRAWSFAPSTGEFLEAIATRPAHDPVASIGRALGDRNVLYKYLSPNLILIVTSSLADSTVAVHLLDSVNGQSLYTTTHTGVDASRPITATMSENWFAYTFFSDPDLDFEGAAAEAPKGFVLTMSELFESPLPNDPGPLEASANFSSLTGHAYIPAVLSQSYVVPAAITYLTTTSTKQGITPRSLLAYSPSLCGIVAIPLPFLSPRKPIGRDPTADEREEGLVRYTPLLDFNPAWTVSHQRELLGINGIVVAPTHMESTSLLFAYGDLDIFGTRVSPIGAFDILGKGFGKVQLVLTIAALAVGTRFLAPMVMKKQVDALWST